MTKEQKDIVVDLVNNSGSGGESNETYDIILNTKTNKVYFKNTEYNCNIEITNDSVAAFLDVTNNELRKVLVDHIKNNNVIDMFIFEDAVTIKSKVIMQMIEPTNEWVFIGAFTEVLTSIKFIN